MMDLDYLLLAVTEYSKGYTHSVNRFPIEHWLSARTTCNGKLKEPGVTRAQIFLQVVAGEKESVLVWERLK